MTLTKLTEIRKLTRNSTSLDIDKAIEHLLLVQGEKKEEEALLTQEIEKQEKVRKDVVEQMQSNGLNVPADLLIPITISNFKKPRRQRKRRKTKKEESTSTNSPTNENIVNNTATNAEKGKLNK